MASGQNVVNAILRFACALCLLAQVAVGQSDGRVHGQVTDDVTGLPIEGVTIQMDLQPVDGTPEQTQRSDAFGFFRQPGLDAGTYDVKFLHAAYTTKTISVSVTDGVWTKASTTLAPIVPGPGEAPIDLTIQVRGAVSNWGMKEVPVRVQRFAAAGDTVPTLELLLRADENGIARFYGAPSGYYRVKVNETGLGNTFTKWETYTTEGTADDKKLIDQAHLISVYLKPIPQTLTFEVSGYDFKKRQYGQKLEDIIVECTGRHPNLFAVDLLPPQVDVTDENGRVTFRGLPGIEYYIEFKRLGYYFETRVISPDAHGELPTAVQTVSLGTYSHNLVLDLAHNYTEPESMQITLPVIIEGQPGTNTDGVVVQGTAYNKPEIGTYGNVVSGLTADQMLVGNYRISPRIAGNAQFQAPIAVGLNHYYAFSFFADGEVSADMPEDLGWNQGHLVPYPITIKPTRVTGRVVVADQCVNKLGDRPTYLPLAGVTLTFREKPGGDVLPVGEKEVTVVTDATGEYAVELYPGAYGMEIDGEPADHMAVDLIKNITADIYGFGGSTSLPWPVLDLWPDPGTVYSQTYWSPAGIIIQGTEEIDLEVRLRREVYCVESALTVDYDAMGHRVVFDQGGASQQYTVRDSDLLTTTATLVRQEGGSYTGTLFLDETNKPRVRWEDLPPGTYTASLSHPRYTFQSTTTLTLRDWPDPGVIPTGGSFDASSGLLYRDSIPLDLYEIPITATLDNPEQPRVTVRYWSVDQNQYGNPTQLNLRLLKPDFAAGYFAPAGRVTSNAWTGYIWDTRNSVFYNARSGDVIYIDGPSASSPGTQPDLGSYDVEVTTFLASDPTEPVSGVHFQFSGLPTVYQTPATITDHTGTPLVVKATGQDTWVWRTPRPAVEIDLSGARPLIRHRIPVSRALNFNLTIMNPVSAAPVEGALVEFFTADGARVMDGVSVYDSLKQNADENGQVVISGKAFLGDYMLRVSCRGYAPQRFRFDADDATPVSGDPSGSQEHVATLNLQPLQGPTLLTTGIPFDRYGAFIPGVRRSGDQSAFNGFAAEPVLTTTWELRFQPPVQSYSVNTFDQVDGSPGVPEAFNFTDPVQFVWLVDEREFEKNFFNGDPVDSFLDEPENAHAIHAYLQRMSIKAGSEFPPKKQYFQKLTRIEADGTPGVFKITGQSPLWLMPPGDFKPAFVVETQAGAVSILRPDYSGAEATKRLTGVPIPSWLGFAFDVMAVSTGAGATQDKLKKYVPNGKFIPFPSFTATIARHKDNGQDTNYIDYNFGLTVIQREGQDSPAGDVSGLAAGILGAEFQTTATISMPGQERRLDLTVASTIAKKDIEPKSYEPKAFKGGTVTPHIEKVGGSVTTTASQNIDSMAPWDLRLTNQIQASIDGSFTADLRFIAEKIPYIGPPLAALRAVAPNGYQLDGISTVGIGLENTMVWETLKPARYVGSTIPPELRARRRHFLGGNEPDAPVNDPNQTTLCFRFGLGISGGIGDGIAGASARMNLVGNTCAGEPSMRTEFNDLGQWPPIKRISGGVTASVSGYLKTPVKKFEKAWGWNLFNFDSQFGTENLIEFIPMQIVLSATDRSASTPGQFLGRGPQTVTGLGEFASPAAGSTDDRFLPWVDYDDVGDQMVLKLSETTGGFGWGTPVDLATGQLIRNVRRLALPDGRHIVVWSGHDDTSGDPFTPESISYCISDTSGANWSTPAEISALSGRVSDMQLVQSGSLITLAWAEGAPGPVSDDSALKVCDFDGSAWETPVLLEAETPRTGFVVLAGGPSAPSSIEVVTMQDVEQFGWTYHLASSHGWNGTTAATPVNLFAFQDAGTIAGYAAPDGTRVLFGNTPFGGMVRASSAPGLTSYTKDTSFTLAAQPGGMQACYIDDPTSPVALLVWTQLAQDSQQLLYALVAPDGTLISGPEPLTRNTKGIYSQVSLLRSSGRSAKVAAWFTNSPPELRIFTINADTGVSGNDADSDTMNDITELLIVDFDSSDGLTTIDQVLPGDDFDHDGFTNLEEDQAGSDPTDISSVPGSNGVTVVAGADAAEYQLTPGSFVVERPAGDVASALDVLYQVSGTATEGQDFSTLSGMVTIPAGNTTAQIIIAPLSDSLPEGAEQVSVTLIADAAYTLGDPVSASINLRDLPVDDWRLRKFGAQAGNPAIAGDLANPDFDGWNNLLEFALVLDPSVPDGFGEPVTTWWMDPGTGKHYLQVVYTESAEAEDLSIVVESSDHIGGWNSGAGHTVDRTASPAPTDGNGNPIRTIRDAVAREDAPAGRRFLRIRVSRN